MKTFNKIITDKTPTLSVTLSYDDRVKSKIIANSDNGVEIAISSDRGVVLQDGTLLENEDGEVLEVVASLEDVTRVSASNLIELCTLAYHLGNRHVHLEISKDGYVQYQTDHVLDEMVLHLGGKIEHLKSKFSPVNGAYSHHHHEHHHDN